MRIAFALLASACAVQTSAAPGSFDTRFGTRGVLNLTTATNGGIPANSSSSISALVVGPDGMVHLGGSLASGLGTISAATFNTRVTADGRVDTTFGVDGVVRRTGYATNHAATDFIAVLASGRIIASDTFEHGCGFTCPVMPPPPGRRTSAYSAAGIPDPGFPGDLDIHTMYESGIPTGAAFPDGTVVTLSRGALNSQSEYPVPRALRANGMRDIQFEQSAAVALRCGAEQGNLTRISATIDMLGRLVVAYGLSKDISGGRYATCILRLDRTGQRDASFGSGGLVSFATEPLSEYVPDAVVTTASGAVRVSLRYRGRDSFTGTARRAGQIRLTSAGLPDTTLAGGATPTFDVPLSSSITQIVPLTDGRTVLSGNQNGATPASPLLPVVVRMTAAGATDSGYGQNGSGVIPLSFDADQAIYPDRIWVSESDGSVLVAGRAMRQQQPQVLGGLVLAKLEDGTNTVVTQPPPNNPVGGGGASGGGGCGITLRAGAPDPMLALLALMAGSALWARRRRPR